jgi:hypothetical protein
MKKLNTLLLFLMLCLGQLLSAQQNEAKTMAAPEKKVMIVYGSDESSLFFTISIRIRKRYKKCCPNSKKPTSVRTIYRFPLLIYKA